MNFSNQLSKGFYYYGLGRLFDKFATLLSVVILARLLTPNDFGFVALSMTFIVLVQSLSESGLEESLIKDADATREDYNAAWTYGRIIRGLLLFSIEYSLSDWISIVYENKEIADIIKVLAFNELLRGFVNIGIVDFVKKREFKKDFKLNLISRTIRVVSAVFLAVILQNVWALILSYTLFNMSTLVLSYILSDYRPSLCFEFSRVKRLFRFGGWIFIDKLVNTGRSIIDKMIIGKILGVEILGLYQISARVSLETSDDVKTIVSKTLFPVLLTITTNKEKIKKFRDILISLIFLSVCFASFISINADFLVNLVLGEKWIGSIPIIKVLALFSILNVLLTSVYPVFKSMGVPKYNFYTNIIQFSLIMLTVFPLIGFYGLYGVVYSLIIGSVFGLIFRELILIKLEAYSIEELKDLFVTALFSILIFSPMYALRLLFDFQYSWVNLFLLTTIFIISSIAALFLIMRLTRSKSIDYFYKKIAIWRKY